MGLWLPNRVMQGAIVLCVAAVALVLWIVLHQPWLGLSVTADAAKNTVTITAIHPDGAVHGVAPGSRLVAVAPAGQHESAIALTPDDVIDEPDTFESYAQIRAFMQRQGQIAALLRAPSLILQSSHEGQIISSTVTPKRRPLSDLPAAFWVQIVTGAGSLLIGMWVLAMRRSDITTRLFALSGAMIMLSAYAAAIYSSRELAIDGGLFRLLSALNHIGALGFGMAMIAMFLCYPRQLVPLLALWIVPGIFGPWLIADVLHALPSQTIGMQLPTLVEMLMIIVCVIVQWFVNRHDPRARAALNWLGLSVIVGAGAFVSLITAPILFSSAPAMQQGHAFGFFLLIYAGLALGVARYRLFDLSEWAFRILFYTAGTLLLIAVDATLVTLLQLQQTTSLGLALIAVGFIYLPLRGRLWTYFVARDSLQDHELFRSVIDISFATSASERSGQWRDLIQKLFDPLAIEDAGQAVDAVELREEGLELLLPAVADTPALALRYPWRGRRLFGTIHRDLARELVRLMRYAEDSRGAYERGSVEERRRIARDLHDDVGARLLSGLYKTELGDTQRLLREAIADIRTIVSGLSTDQPPLGQMIAALRHETGERLITAGLDLNWPLTEIDDTAPRLDYQSFRCFTSAQREVVSNIIRHAKARNVDIRVDVAEDHLVTTIADDGVGIDPAYVEGSPQGSGIRGLLRRVSEINGTVSITPRAKGTAVKITIPMRATGEAQHAGP